MARDKIEDMDSGKPESKSEMKKEEKIKKVAPGDMSDEELDAYLKKSSERMNAKNSK
jgi:hypothetical protein